VSSFKREGLITITTDFGHKGPFIGTMKGVILSRFPEARIVDITHETSVHWPAEAGFWISHAYPYFPKGTVHIAVVDPGVGTQRRIVCLVKDGHVFLAPDNGLLGSLAEGDVQIFELDFDKLSRFDIKSPSATFHGRDVFAPIAAELAAGNFAPSDLGPETLDLVPGWLEEPTATDDRVDGVVVTTDHFGNLICNIEGRLFENFRDPVVIAGGHRVPVRRTYGDVSPGDYLALINSFGVLEIARAEQSAAEGLGLGRGAPVQVVNDSG